MTGSVDLLPPLTTEAERWCETSGTLVSYGNRTLLVLPFRAPVERSRGRRYEVAIADTPPARRLVLSVDGRAAVVPPPGPRDRGAVRVRIRAVPDRAPRRVSAELTKRLAAHGATLDELPAHEANQLVLMINESTSREIRSARIEAAVQAVLARRRHATG